MEEREPMRQDLDGALIADLEAKRDSALCRIGELRHQMDDLKDEHELLQDTVCSIMDTIDNLHRRRP